MGRHQRWEDEGQAYCSVRISFKHLAPERLRAYVANAEALITEVFGPGAPNDPDGVAYGHMWVITPFAQLPPTAVTEDPDGRIKADLAETRAAAAAEVSGAT